MTQIFKTKDVEFSREKGRELTLWEINAYLGKIGDSRYTNLLQVPETLRYEWVPVLQFNNRVFKGLINPDWGCVGVIHGNSIDMYAVEDLPEIPLEATGAFFKIMPVYIHIDRGEVVTIELHDKIPKCI